MMNLKLVDTPSGIGRWWIGLLVATTAGVAGAAPISLTGSRFIDRSVAAESAQELQAADLVRKAEGPPAPPPNSVNVGVAYEHDADSDTFTLPYTLLLAPGHWHIAVAGDGYTDKHGDGDTQQGLADISTKFAYSVPLFNGAGAPKLVPELDLTFPTGAPIGSQRLSEAAALTLNFGLGSNWMAFVGGTVSRDEEAQAGVAHYTRHVQARLMWAKDDWTSAFVAVGSGRGAGGGRVTQIDAEYDFPLMRKWNLSGAVSAARSFPSSSASSSVEFDLCYAF